MPARRWNIILTEIGLWLLDRFVRSPFEAHIQQQHGADFEVCPRCPKWVRLLDRIGQWLVG